MIEYRAIESNVVSFSLFVIVELAHTSMPYALLSEAVSVVI